MKTQRLLLAFLTFFALLLPAVASEQTSINGTIKDADGGVLPGVLVSAKNVATGLVRSATSTGDGQYRILGIPPPMTSPPASAASPSGS